MRQRTLPQAGSRAEATMGSRLLKLMHIALFEASVAAEACFIETEKTGAATRPSRGA